MSSTETSSASQSSRLDGGEPRTRSRLGRALDSSLVIGPFRQVCRGSLFCGVMVRLGRSLSGRSSWVASRFASDPSSRGFPRALRIVTASRGVTSVDRVFLAMVSAWQESAAKRAVIDRTIARLEGWQQVRLVGWVMVIAALTRAIVGFAPLSEGWWGLVALAFVLTIGTVLIAASRPVALAWRNWRRSSDQ